VDDGTVREDEAAFWLRGCCAFELELEAGTTDLDWLDEVLRLEEEETVEEAEDEHVST
jgi:hypothetical protein